MKTAQTRAHGGEVVGTSLFQATDCISLSAMLFRELQVSNKISNKLMRQVFSLNRQYSTGIYLTVWAEQDSPCVREQAPHLLSYIE